MSTPAFISSAIGHVRTPVYRNAYSLIISNGLTSALGLVYWSLAARAYPTQIMGASSAAISMMLFLSGAAQLNLRPALLRLLPESGARAAWLVQRTYLLALVLSACIGLVVFGGAAVVGGPWAAIGPLAGPAGVLLMVVGTACWSIFNLQDGVLTGLRRTGWVPVENGLYALAKIGVLLACVVVLPTLGIVVSWVVPSIAIVVVVSVILARRWIPAYMATHGDRHPMLDDRTLATFVAADSMGALFALGASTLLPVLVVGAVGPSTGAYFAITWTILAALMLVPINMAASLTVESVHARAALGPQVRRLAVHLYRLLIPLVVAAIALAGWGLHLFGAAYSDNATTALRVGALGLLPFAATTLFLATARIEARSRAILVVQVTTATVTLALSGLLLGPMSITGVTLAWLIAQTLVALVVVPTQLLPLMRGDSGAATPAGTDQPAR
jgi:O-antigen/teichoic acid export membrane protein